MPRVLPIDGRIGSAPTLGDRREFMGVKTPKLTHLEARLIIANESRDQYILVVPKSVVCLR